MKPKTTAGKRYLYHMKWESNLEQPFPQIPFAVNDDHLQATILLAQQEAALKQRRTHISFSRFLAKQIGFLGRKIWSAQGIFLLVISGLLLRFTEYPFTLRYQVKFLACLSILIFMAALPLLYRPVRYRMQEIESASRFSGARLLLARLIVIGIGDVCLLTGIFLTAILKTVLPAGTAVFCLCFPFLLAGSGCLYMLGHLSPDRFFMGSLLFCFFLVVLTGVLPAQYSILCQPPSPAVQILLCLLPLAFCVRQLRCLITASSYAEMQLN